MEKLTVGVVTGDWGPGLGLEAAARRRLDLSVESITLEQSPSASVAGLIVDAPLGSRARILGTLTGRWRVPILVETPFAGALADGSALYERLSDVPVCSSNPLRYSLPTRRLLEEVARSGEPMETFFAAWRFQPDRSWDHGLPQLLDYVGGLCGSAPRRISAMRRERPEVLLVLLRYGNGVVGSLELGAHLPRDFATDAELVLECFCRQSVYHCAPENQAITIRSSGCQRHGWLPDPADEMLAAFVEVLRGRAPARGASDDLHILALAEEIRGSAAEGAVRSGTSFRTFWRP